MGQVRCGVCCGAGLLFEWVCSLWFRFVVVQVCVRGLLFEDCWFVVGSVVGSVGVKFVVGFVVVQV